LFIFGILFLLDARGSQRIGGKYKKNPLLLVPVSIRAAVPLWWAVGYDKGALGMGMGIWVYGYTGLGLGLG